MGDLTPLESALRDQPNALKYARGAKPVTKTLRHQVNSTALMDLHRRPDILPVSGWVGTRLANRDIKGRATRPDNHLISPSVRLSDLVHVLMTTKIGRPIRLND